MMPNFIQVHLTVLQIILAILILSLSASLAVRWSNLETSCRPEPYDDECSKIISGAGGLKYCVFVGVWVLFDVVLWGFDSLITSLHWYLLVLSSQVTGGFALGGGCVRLILKSTHRQVADVYPDFGSSDKWMAM